MMRGMCLHELVVYTWSVILMALEERSLVRFITKVDRLLLKDWKINFTVLTA